MIDFLTVTRPGLAGFCLIAFVYKLWTASNIRRDPATAALLVALLTTSITWTLTIPVVSQSLDLWSHLPNAAILLKHLCGAVFLGPALLVTVISWSNPPAAARRKTRHVIGYASAIGSSMIVLWTFGPVETSNEVYLLANSHVIMNSDQPPVMAYLVLYQTSLTIGLAMLLRLSWSSARLVDDAWLRRGLRITALGALGYLVVIADRLVFVGGHLIGFEPANWEVLTAIFARLAVVGVVVGLLAPSIAAQWTQVRTWWRCVCLFRALGELWLDLSTEFREVALPYTEATWKSYVHTDELRYLLNRRAIEIRDSWRALRPYLPDSPTKLDNNINLFAVAAARSLHVGLAAKASGAAAYQRLNASHLERLDEASNLDEDINYLARVGRAYSITRARHGHPRTHSDHADTKFIGHAQSTPARPQRHSNTGADLREQRTCHDQKPLTPHTHSASPHQPSNTPQQTWTHQYRP